MPVTYTFVKKIGAPAGTITFTYSNTSLIIDDGANTSIATTNARVANELEKSPYLMYQGQTGTYTPPPVLEDIFLADGQLSKHRSDPVPAFPKSTAVITTASLNTNAGESGTITMTKGWRLLHAAADKPSRVRLYASTAYRDADAGRGPVLPAGDHGCMFEATFTESITAIQCSPVPFGFCDTAAIPYRVENLGTTGAVTVTLIWQQED